MAYPWTVVNNHCRWERERRNDGPGRGAELRPEPAEAAWRRAAEWRRPHPHGQGHRACLQQSLNQNRDAPSYSPPQAEKFQIASNRTPLGEGQQRNMCLKRDPLCGPAQREALKLRIKEVVLSNRSPPQTQLCLLEFEAFAALIVTIATINHKHSLTPNWINTEFLHYTCRRKGMPISVHIWLSFKY